MSNQTTVRRFAAPSIDDSSAQAKLGHSRKCQSTISRAFSLAIMLAGTLLGLLQTVANAQTPTNSYNSSTAVWTPSAPTGSGSSAAIIQYTNPTGFFFGAPILPAGTFSLNGLIFDIAPGTSGSGIQYLNSTATNFINLVANGGNNPFINITGGSSATGAQILGANIVLNANTTIGGAGNGVLSFNLNGANGVISGTGGLIFSRTGTGPNAYTLLSAANTFTGGATINSGVVVMGNAAAFGATGGGDPGLIINGGTLAANSSFSFTRQLTVNGSFGYGLAGLFTGTLTASGPITLNNTPTITTALGTNLTMSGIVSGTGLIKSGLGTLTLSGSNNFSGDISLDMGTLTLGNANALGSVPNSLVINNGTLTATTTLTIANSLTLNNSLVIGGSSALTFSTATVNLNNGVGNRFINNSPSVTFQGALTGSTGLFKTNSGTLFLQGASTYTAPTTVGFSSLATAGGSLTLNTATGTLLSTTAINVLGAGFGTLGATSASTFTLDNTSASNSSRLSTTTPIQLIGGTFTHLAATTGGTASTVGPLVIQGGFSTVFSSPTATSGSVLTFASLARSNQATVFFRASTSQFLNVTTGGTTTTPAPGTSAVGGIFFTTAPTLIGGGGAANTTTISIIPWAYSESPFIGSSTPTFATYTPTGGIRGLSSNEYASTISATVSSNNVRLFSASTLNAASTINSLNIGGTNVGVTGTGTLTLTSGGFLSNSAGTVIGLAGLNFNTAEAIFHISAGSTLVSSVISGSGGLTKSGAGTLTLAGANSFTGTVAINQGLLVANSGSQLGASTNGVALGGGTLQVLSSVGAVNRSIEIGTLGGALSAGAAFSSVNFAGVISDSALLPVAAGALAIQGPGTVILSAANTYTGGTFVLSGVLALGSNNAAGTGSVTLSSGVGLAAFGSARVLSAPLILSGTGILAGAQELTIAGAVTLAASSTLNVTASVPAIISGNIGTLNIASASLTKDGFGTLTLLGTTTLNGGSLTVTAGKLILAGANGSSSLNTFTTLNPGTTLALDNSAAVNNSRLNPVSSIFLFGSEIQLLGGSSSVTQAIGTVTLQYKGTITVGSTGSATVLTTASFSSFSGSTLFIRGDNLGTVGAAQVFGSGAIVASTGGGGGAGTTNRTILTGIYGDSSASGSGSGWVRYDSTLGYVLLNPSTEYASSFVASTSNAALTSAITGLDSPTSVNSLILRGGGSVAGAGTLAITSGNLMSTGTANSGIGVNLSVALTFNVIAVSNLTITGNLAISGSNVFAKNGPGVLTMAGISTYTGQTFINEGTLRLGSTTGVSDGAIVIAPGAIYDLNGINKTQSSIASSSTSAFVPAIQVLLGSGTLTLNSASSFTYSGQISGAGNLVKLGAGTMTVGRVLNYAGTTTVSAGILAAPDDTFFGLSNSIRINGGTLNYTGFSGATVLTTRSLVLNSATSTLDVGGSLTYFGGISGAGNLLKAGFGTLLLSGSNSYTGGTTLSTGTLSIGGTVAQNTNGALGNTALPLTISAANTALTFTEGVKSFGLGIQMTYAGGTFTSPFNTTFNFTSTPVFSFNGGIDFGSASGSRRITPTNGVVINFNGVVSGNGGFFNNSAYFLNFNTANTFNGLIGTLNSGNSYGLNNDQALGTATLDIASSGTGTVRSDNGDRTISNPIFNTGGNTPQFITTGYFSLTFTGAMNIGVGALGTVSNSTRTYRIDNAITTFSGDIIGTGASNTLIKTGAGILQLTGSNTFAGGLSVTQGLVRFSSDASLGGTAGTTAVSLNGGGLQVNAGGLTIARPITVGASGATIDTFGNDFTLSGNITGAGTFTKTGAGTLTISGTPGTAFTGLLNITGGTVDYQGTLSTSNITLNGGSLLMRRTISPASATSISINAGTLTLLGATGSSTSNMSYSVNVGGELKLDNTSVSVLDRIAGNVTLNGGNLTLIGNAASASTESFGTLTLGTGTSVITLAPGSSGTAQFSATSLSRGTNATSLWRGTGLGATDSQFFFTTAPSLAGGLGADGTTTISILSGAVGDASATGFGSSFITYNSINGIRLLDIATEYATSITSGSSSTNNINVTSEITAIDAATTINSLRLEGTGSVAGTGAITISTGNLLSVGTNTISNPLTFSSVAANISVGTQLTLNGAITTTFSGADVVKSGPGTLTYGTVMSYTAATRVDGGTLSAGAGSVLPSTNLTLNGGVLQLNDFSQTTGALISPANVPGASVLLGNSSITTLTVGSGNLTGTFNGVISGSGNFIKTGAGTQTLSGVNAFTGFARVQAGALTLGRLDALATVTQIEIGATGSTTSATLNLPGLSVPATFNTPIVVREPGTGATRTLNTGSGTQTAYNGSGTGLTTFPFLTITSGITVEGPLTLTNSAYIKGNIVDGTTAGSLLISGSTTILAGTNTYSGGTTVSGTATIGLSNGDLTGLGTPNTSVFGTGTLNFTSAGGTLSLFAMNAATATLANNVSLSATSNGVFALAGVNDLAFTGSVSLGAAGQIVNVTNFGVNLTLAGDITGSAPTLTKTGLGRLVLSGNNSFTGNVLVSAGFLVAPIASSLSSAVNTVTVANGAVLELSGGTTYASKSLIIDGIGVTMNSFPTGALSSTGGDNTWLGGVQLANSTTNAIGVSTGSLTIAGPVTASIGSAGLVKYGAGSLILGSSATFGGGITVQSGEMRINGALSSGEAINVLGNAVLSGNGTIGRSVIVQSGGFIRPGASSTVPGMLTINGDLTYAGNSTFDFGFAGANFSSLTVSGNIAFNPTDAVTIRITDLNMGPVPLQDSYQIFSGMGVITGFNSQNFLVDSSAAPAFNSATIEIQGSTISLVPVRTPTWWTGQNGTGNWSDPNNWSSSVTGSPSTGPVAGATNDVFFNADSVITNPVTSLGGDQAASSVTVRGSAGLTIASGGTLTLRDGITTESSAGVVTLNNNVALRVDQTWTLRSTTNPVTVNGVISQTSSASKLTLVGSGTLVLQGLNTFTGGFVLGSGQVNVNNGGTSLASSLGTGTFTINGGTLGNTSGGNVTVATANSVIINSSFSFAGPNDLNLGTGMVTLGGSVAITTTAGTLTLSSITAGSFGLTKNGTGGLVIGSGTISTLSVNSGTFSASTDMSTLATFNGGTSTFLGTTRTVGAAVVNNSAATVNFNATTTNITGVAGLNLSAGTVTFLAGTGGAIANLTVSGGSVTLANQTENVTVATGGTISGYLGNNSSTSSLTVSGVSTIVNIGSGAFVKTANLSAGSGTVNAANALSVVGNGGAGTLLLTSGGAAITASIPTGNLFTVSGSNAVLASTLTVSGGTLTMTSSTNIVNLPDVSIAVAASSTLNLVNGSDHRLGSLTFTTAGSNLQLSNAKIAFGGISSTGAGNVISTSSGTVAVSLVPSTSISVVDSLTIASSIVDWLNNGGTPIVTSINKTGSGTLILAAASSYTGVTTITEGAINVRNTFALGSLSAGTVVLAGAALQIQNDTFIPAEALELNGMGLSGAGALQNISGTNYYSGLVTLGGSTSIQSDSGSITLTNLGTITGVGLNLTVGGVGNVTMNSIIGTSTGTLTKNGTGTLTLSAAGTYTGATNVNGGTLFLTGSTAVGSTVNVATAGTLAGTGSVLGNATVTGNGVINFSAGGAIGGTLSATGGFWNGLGQVNGAATSSSGVLTIGSGANLSANAGLSVTGGTISGIDTSSRITGNLSYTSALSSTFAGSIVGATSNVLLNNSAANLILTGLNTYGGTTTITAGTLTVNNSLLGNGGTISISTVGAGGALEAAGVIQRPIVSTSTSAVAQLRAIGDLSIGNITSGINYLGTLNTGTFNVAVVSGDQIVTNQFNNVVSRPQAFVRFVTMDNGSTLGSNTRMVFRGSNVNDSLTILPGASATINGNVVFGYDPNWRVTGEPAQNSSARVNIGANSNLTFTGVVRGNANYTIGSGGSLNFTGLNAPGFSPGSQFIALTNGSQNVGGTVLQLYFSTPRTWSKTDFDNDPIGSISIINVTGASPGVSGTARLPGSSGGTPFVLYVNSADSNVSNRFVPTIGNVFRFIDTDNTWMTYDFDSESFVSKTPGSKGIIDNTTNGGMTLAQINFLTFNGSANGGLGATSGAYTLAPGLEWSLNVVAGQGGYVELAIVVIPEPHHVLLICAAILGLGVYLRRRFRPAGVLTV